MSNNEYPNNMNRRSFVKNGLIVTGALSVTTGTAAADSKSGGNGNVTPIDTCPTVIDEPGEYELTQDLTISAGETCILIEANNVTLDGNGNTITGPDGSGSIVTIGVENVTVRNVVVDGGTDGISFNNVTGGCIADSTVRNAPAAGIEIFESAENQVNRNILTANGSGITVTDGLNNEFNENTCTENGVGIDLGLNETGSNGNVFEDNVVSENTGDGFTLSDSSENEIIGNTANNNANNGITLAAESNNNIVTDNILLNNGNEPVVNQGAGNTIANNQTS